MWEIRERDAQRPIYWTTEAPCINGTVHLTGYKVSLHLLSDIGCKHFSRRRAIFLINYNKQKIIHAWVLLCSISKVINTCYKCLPQRRQVVSRYRWRNLFQTHISHNGYVINRHQHTIWISVSKVMCILFSQISSLNSNISTQYVEYLSPFTSQIPKRYKYLHFLVQDDLLGVS